MPTPGRDNDLGLGPAAEPFHGETLVSEFSIEALVGAILHRFSGSHVVGVLGLGREAALVREDRELVDNESMSSLDRGR